MNWTFFMLVKAFLLACVGVVLLVGCGGKVGPKTATITGVVTDLDGNPVRGARVFTSDSTAATNVGGVYELSGVREGDVQVTADIEVAGIVYVGHNVAVTFEGEHTQSVNIALTRQDEQAYLHGIVYDPNGLPMQGAKVFAYGGALSSVMDVSDKNGKYRIEGLAPGLSYEVNAGARGYESAETVLTLGRKQDRDLDFQLGFASGSRLPPPDNLSAVSWVTPRSRAQRDDTYEWIKQMIDPKRPTRSISRGIQDRFVEIDLNWDPVRSEATLGYGVYRAFGDSDQFSSVDFLREPLAGNYVDLAAQITTNSAYSYRVTTLNTVYPNDPKNSESSPTDRVVIDTLDELRLGPLTMLPLTFTWYLGSGSEEYVVFLFDEYPALGVSSIWNNSDAPTPDLSLRYSGPPLVPGRRYYYLVLGLAFGGSSRTLSEIGAFTAP